MVELDKLDEHMRNEESASAERDAAFEQMAIRHGFYRTTDTPTQVLEKIVR